MNRNTLAAILVALAMAWMPGDASATATPTQTPTETPTATPTSTPTYPLNGLFVYNETCETPPCDTSGGTMGGLAIDGFASVPIGYKTVKLETSGTITAKLMCQVAGGSHDTAVQLGSDVTAPAIIEFRTSCKKIFVRTTACTDCLLTSWVKIDL